MPRILFVDDERGRTEEFVLGLQDVGFEVIVMEETDQALEWLSLHGSSLACIITDVMMPWGDSFSKEETRAGLLTGLSVYNYIRSIISPIVPIVFLTNSTDPAIRQAIAGDRNAWLIYKFEMLYDEFADFLCTEAVSQR